ncbi:MAG: nucleotidyltransferase domain-containing protein [Vallitaleaceae bacterium]|nr:nucleotidyltransferase domain-containing protein [Vallitaleaceae bacterium]
MYGLLERDLDYIRKALESFPEIEKAFVFGSRAIGNYKKGSDVDLAIIGEKVTLGTVRNLFDILNEEYPLPYFFDIINYTDLENNELIQHIQQYGKPIYTNLH